MIEEKELNKIIAKNIRYYLEELDMSQLELAKAMNCSPSAISNWCHGDKLPRMDRIDALCTIFGCTRSDLMGDRKNTSNESNEPKTIDIAKLIGAFEKENNKLTYKGIPLTDEQIATAKAVLSVFKNVVDK